MRGPSVHPRAFDVALTGLGVLVVGAIDFISGFELRVYPLYYLPVAFAAWRLGWSWTIAAAAVSTGAWMGSNYLAGLSYSTRAVWMFNAGMHGISFLVVGGLLARLEIALAHEKQLSRLDPLTTLLNPRAFREEAVRLLSIARRKQRPVTLAYIDIDGFKAVNDTHGHHAGDAMLQGVAAAIGASIRVSDVAARMGGDEFALLLLETGHGEARVVLDRLRARIGETLAGAPHPVTASIGAAVFATVPESLDHMLREADRRMYAAKAAGKDRAVLEVAEDTVSAGSG